MISGFRRSEILQCARRVVKTHGFESIPIRPREIAAKANIHVYPWSTKELGISGCLMKMGDSFGIGYSTAIGNLGFENFTVAHELGHYFLDGHAEHVLKNGTHVSKSGFLSNDQHEREADLFASEMLMPEFLFRPAINAGGAGFRLIQKLAEQGETSIVATSIQYAKLADDPVAVILSEGQVIKWCILSASMAAYRGVHPLEKGSFLPPNSPSRSFNRESKNVDSGRKVEDFTSLQTWFERAPNVEIQEDVIGLGHYGKTLTILFTESVVEDEDEGESEDFGEGADTGLPSVRWTKR